MKVFYFFSWRNLIIFFITFFNLFIWKTIFYIDSYIYIYIYNYYYYIIIIIIIVVVVIIYYYYYYLKKKKKKKKDLKFFTTLCQSLDIPFIIDDIDLDIKKCGFRKKEYIQKLSIFKELFENHYVN